MLSVSPSNGVAGAPAAALYMHDSSVNVFSTQPWSPMHLRDDAFSSSIGRITVLRPAGQNHIDLIGLSKQTLVVVIESVMSFVHYCIHLNSFLQFWSQPLRPLSDDYLIANILTESTVCNANRTRSSKAGLQRLTAFVGPLGASSKIYWEDSSWK